MPLTVEDFNRISGTNFSQSKFNEGFLTTLASVPKEKYNQLYSKIYLCALKESINSQIDNKKDIDIVGCMNSFDDMFKSSVALYNDYAKEVSTFNTIEYLENGGVSKTQIRNQIDDLLTKRPATEVDKCKKDIIISANEDVVWGEKEKNSDEIGRLNNAALRKVNTIIDGTPTIKYFEGQVNELEVNINLNYEGKAPSSVKIGKESKQIVYKNQINSKETKLHNAVQVVKAMEDIHEGNVKSASMPRLINNTKEISGIDKLKNKILSSGYTKEEYNLEHSKESPKVSYIREYESKIGEFVKESGAPSINNKQDLLKNLGKETSFGLETKAVSKPINNKEVSKDISKDPSKK